jgi:S-adenosylmethionine synthetase
MTAMSFRPECGEKGFFMSDSRFTSESVCAGHPDKVCDQISDAIVDAVLAQDPLARIAAETIATHGRLILAGEITTEARVDYEAVARKEIHRLGYTRPEWNFYDGSPVDVLIHEQSPEIGVGVAQEEQGAGDQGMMFGYACTETPELMPMPIMLAHRLVERIDLSRTDGTLPYLRPDGKAQVTLGYRDGRPDGVEKVVLAVPHDEGITLSQVQAALVEHVIAPVLAGYGFSVEPEHIVVNGTGIWHTPGPSSDTGLTGRKIVVDGYGGYARVGGGAFSGKDPSKVDRSGAYAARYIAKNIVAAGLATRCEVGLAYVIGAKRPLMEEIETFGSARVSRQELAEYARGLLDTSVSGIIRGLDLARPIYQSMAAYGHFGRAGVPWETVKVPAAV